MRLLSTLLRKMRKNTNAPNLSLLLGTNLIHDFTAVTFSVKLPFFREIRDFSWILMLLLSFMKVFTVLSTAFMRISLFATCHTSALSSRPSWHVFTVLLAYIWSWVFVVQKFQMCYSSSTDFLVCINIAPRNNGCGAREFSVNFSNSFREFFVKFGTF